MTLPYKIDGPLDLRNEELLFWPNNPRLKISDFSEVKYSTEQLLSKNTQEKIWHLLCTNEHEVPKLGKSMIQSGFMREKALIVLPIQGAQKYLVLEGNRRLAASRLILRSKGDINASVKKSLESIPCWLFKHTSANVPIAAAISRMVAEAHIKGQKPHTKIQQAHMLYDAYMGFLNEAGQSSFVKRTDTVRDCAAFFELSTQEFEQELAVFQLYRQLAEARYKIDHRIREKLTWVYRNPRQFARYFEYDHKSFTMRPAGLERYFDLFIRQGSAVRSPSAFKAFQNIMRYGSAGDIEIVRTEPTELSAIEAAVMDSKQENQFLTELQRIEKRIGRLKLYEYKDSEEERRAIQNIKHLVSDRLDKLTSDLSQVESGVETGQEKVPSDVGACLKVPYAQLATTIQQILLSKPNASCVRSKIPTILLKKWSIRTRGKPRERFVNYIEGVVDRMAAERKVVAYKSKNARVRLPDRFC